jgi:hypothetical protein
MKRKKINNILILVASLLFLILVFYIISTEKSQQMHHESFSDEHLRDVAQRYNLEYRDINPDKSSNPDNINIENIKKSLRAINY